MARFRVVGEVRHASDYFEQFYEWALYLIEKGMAYVCDLSPEEAREYRGTLTEPGKTAPIVIAAQRRTGPSFVACEQASMQMAREY